MGGHEQERLSAYLDDALAPGDRDQVAAHVQACAECAGRLAELAAVDAAVASMPSEAPPGYLEALPARVRARLEPRAARRLPAWTWAVAAALLLAVVTPLTLLKRPADGSLGSPPALPAAAAVPESSATQTPAEPPATEEARAERKADTQPQRRALASPMPKKRESGFAAAPTEADARAPQAPVAPVAQPALPPPPAAREQEAEAVADAGAMAEVVAPAAHNQAKASADRSAAAGSRDDLAPLAADEARLARGRAGAAAGTVALPKLVAAEAEWQRLDAARPHTPAEWRRLREEWRRFAAQGPGQAQADEARVRVIEAGRAAWRSGGDPADETLFRRDAALYLERDDALQKERVAALLRARD